MVFIGTAGAIAVGVTAAAGIASSVIQANAAKSAAQTQAQAAQQAGNQQYAMYMQARADQMPYTQAGYGALANEQALANQPLNYPAWDPSQYAFHAPTTGEMQLDPGYEFRVREGLKALQRSGAAAGMTLSGAQAKGLADWNQQAASQEYQNVFNRSLDVRNTNYNAAYDAWRQNWNQQLTRRQQLFNEQAGIAGTGQTATQQLGSLGSATAARAGGYTAGAGNALAAGIMGGANAYGNIFQGIGQAANQYATLRAFQQWQANQPGGANVSPEGYVYGTGTFNTYGPIGTGGGGANVIT